MRGLLHRIAADDPSKSLDTVESILSHLAAILNTERGDGYSHPELGVSLSSLLKRWPSTRTEVLKHICRTIEEHEPRLTNVEASTVPGERARLGILIQADCSGQPVKIRTDLAPTGHMAVREYGEP